MYIIVETFDHRFIRKIDESTFFKMCGSDQRMFDDYCYCCKHHPFRKDLQEWWNYYDDNGKLIYETTTNKNIDNQSDTRLNNRKYEGSYPFTPLQPIEGEQWKEIRGYDGQYIISNYGRVCSAFNKFVWRRLKGFAKDTRIVSLRNIEDGIRHHYEIARLVLETFEPIENSGEKTIKYKDGDSYNVKLSNLEWSD